MNNPWRLVRKNSSETPLVAKKKPASPTPRNPLRDLSNSGERGSVAAPSAKGNSSTLRSNASPRSTLARSKSQPRTPQSAPSSRAAQGRLDRGSPVPSRTPSRSNLQAQKQAVETNPRRAKSPTIAPEAKARRPKCSSMAPSQNRGSFGRIVPKCNAFEPRGGTTLRRNASKSRAFADCTPEKPVPTRATGIREAGRLAAAPTLQSTPEDEGEKRHSTTPTPTATTPPIQVSISPEIICGPSVQPTPACFAAGHRVVGIPDRRKCRPRGILKVSDGASVKIVDIFQSDAPEELSSKTTVTPPLAKASMQWLSSPSAGVNGSHSEGSSSSCGVFLGELRAEASVNWLLPPAFKDAATEHAGDVLVRRQCDCESTTPVSNCTPELAISEEYSLSTLETTPSSVVGVYKTPGTDSSISPFSMILKKATDISGLNSLRPKVEARRCNYLLNSSIAEDLRSDCGAVPDLPPTCSDLNKQPGSMQSFEEEEKLEDVEFVGSSSPQRKVVEGLRESSVFLSQSFQFGCTASSSNSVDLTQFYKTPHFQRIAAGQLRIRGRDRSSSESESRISWREGLLSRMFELGELSSCLREDENEDVDCDRGVPPLSAEDDCKVTVPEHVDGDGFGSFEYTHGKPNERGYNDSDPDKFAPLAESMSIENEGLVSSSDSDWRMFFKNQLFEV